MLLFQNPVFRQEIIPWYDSRKACFLVLIAMFIAFLFSLAGLSVASEITEYRKYLWVPLLTTLLSAGVMISTSIRLIRRYINRFQK
jgi:hypothetical protein